MVKYAISLYFFTLLFTTLPIRVKRRRITLAQGASEAKRLKNVKKAYLNNSLEMFST